MDILINLLPEERRNEIRDLRNVGVVLKIGMAAISALAVLGFFSYACLYFIEFEERAVQREFEIFQKSDVYKKTKSAQDSLREYNKIAGTVKSGLEKQEKYWDIVFEINSLVPEGVTLDYFGVSEEGEVSLKGVARTRADLLLLKERMEKSDVFDKPEFPISSFVAGKEADFEFKAKIK